MHNGILSMLAFLNSFAVDCLSNDYFSSKNVKVLTHILLLPTKSMKYEIELLLKSCNSVFFRNDDVVLLLPNHVCCLAAPKASFSGVSLPPEDT